MVIVVFLNSIRISSCLCTVVEDCCLILIGLCLVTDIEVLNIDTDCFLICIVVKDNCLLLISSNSGPLFLKSVDWCKLV